MKFYPSVTEKDKINSVKLAEQQKKQRAEKIKNRILKQTHKVQLAETFRPITNEKTDLDDSTIKLTQVFKKLGSDDGNTQTPSIQKVTATKALRDTLLFMKGSKTFPKLRENPMVMYFGILYILKH